MKHQGVFIGLGGAGVFAAAHLKARLLKQAGSRESLGKQCRFVFIDTDTRAYNKMNSLYAKDFGNQNLIDDDWVPFSGVSPLHLYRLAVGKKAENNLDDDMKVLLSFVDERSASSFKPVRLEEGASANRQQGRVAIWSQWRNAQRKISACIEGLKNPKNPEQSALSIPFYILSGTCGGTGSSMFLDIAYLVDRTVKSHFKGREPSVRAVLFMPEWYIQFYRKDSNEDIVRKYQSNAYAFFEEVNYFLADYHAGEDAERGVGFEKVFVAPAIEEQVENYNKKWSVFSFAICIDSTSEQEAKFDDDQMYRNTAELIYHWHRTEVQSSFVSSFDNQLRDNYLAKTRVPAFVTMGYRALQYPDKLVNEYFTARFLFEFFKYGLLSDDSGARQYLQSADGRKWLQTIIDDSLKPHISTALDDATKEHFRNAKEAVNEGVAQFHYQDERISLGEKVRNSFRKMTGATNSSYDPSKVGDANALNQFRSEAERQILGLEARLKQMFSEAAGETSERKLLGECRNQIERVLEQAFLAFGLPGASLVSAELESRLSQLKSEYIGEQTGLKAQLSSLDASIADVDQRCRQKKDDLSLGDLQKLVEKKLKSSYQLTILEQRIRLLEKLVGSGGTVDRYKSYLRSMTELVAEWVLTGVSNDSGKSIKSTFDDVLSSSGLTEDTVTTTYLPNLDSLTQGGRLNSAHPIANAYVEMVPQANTQPVRRAITGDIWTDPKGMHRIMIDMLGTGKSDGDLANGKPQSLFIRCLGSPGELADIPRAFETSARRFISRLIGQKNSVSVETEFANLSPGEKERIKDQFANGTGTFCQMDSSLRSKPLDMRLYVGQNADLATALGCKDGAESRFVRSVDDEGLLYITAKALWTIDEYPFYEQYKRIYEAQKRAITNGNAVNFSPHIHQLFNQLGVKDGMRRLVRPGVNSEIFVLVLLLNKLFHIAKDFYFPLFRDMVYWDTDIQGNQATEPSPIKFSTEDVETVRLVETFALKNGKLLFEKGNFGVVVQPYLNLKELFESLEADHPAVFTQFQRVDDFFRLNCSREWAADDGPLSRAFNALRAEFDGAMRLPITAEVTNYYAEMNNRLLELYRELHSEVRKSQRVTRDYRGSPNDNGKPFVPNAEFQITI